MSPIRSRDVAEIYFVRQVKWLQYLSAVQEGQFKWGVMKENLSGSQSTFFRVSRLWFTEFSWKFFSWRRHRQYKSSSLAIGQYLSMVGIIFFIYLSFSVSVREHSMFWRCTLSQNKNCQFYCVRPRRDFIHLPVPSKQWSSRTLNLNNKLPYHTTNTCKTMYVVLGVPFRINRFL